MMRVLFIHGRAQENRTAEELKAEWLSALNGGLSNIKRPTISEDKVTVAYYGKILHDLSAKKAPEEDEMKRGDDFAQFMAEAAIELTSKAELNGISVELTPEVDPDFLPRGQSDLRSLLKDQGQLGDFAERGVQNWPWVIAAIKGLDKAFPTVSEWSISRLLRDVYVYIKDESTREAIDSIVEAALTPNPTLIVSHSLGTVVAYNVLNKRERNIPGLITLGSPLGIKAIKKRLEPIVRPKVGPWTNLYDKRDIVALNPLNSASFARLKPEIVDLEVLNESENRHNIKPYLQAAATCEEISAIVSSGSSH